MITGGQAETVVPAKAVNLPDMMRLGQLYDELFVVNADVQTVPGLAESAEPDSTGKVWTIRIRQGVTFHSGKELTADDVIYTMRSWTSQSSFAYGLSGSQIDAAGLRKRDAYTIEVPLVRANARFPDLTTAYNQWIVPEGYKPGDKPDGTGPFVFESFTPGSNSLFRRNPNYWVSGLPYVDEFEVISSFTDEPSRFNALVGGEIDVLPSMQFSDAKAQLSADQVTLLQAQGTACSYFYMRVDKPPFTDVRVRQAMRLLVNRPQLVEEAFDGLGVVGNDLFGHHCPFYADDLIRQYDPEMAKSLLKSAGQENVALTLQTSPVVPGIVEAATVFVTQASQIGVKVNIVRDDPSQYFNTATLYLKMPFAQAYLNNVFSLQFAYGQTCIPNASFWETHWDDPKSVQLLYAANAAQDPATATSLWHQYQLQQFNQGGYIIWGENRLIDGVGKNIHGVSAGRQANLSNNNLKGAWIA